jgi:predicted dehydrogenase
VHTSAQAQALVAAVQRQGTVFGVTHNYTGYPLVRQMREMVRSGAIGMLRKVIVEYHQGWPATAVEDTGNKQAAWRMDPRQSGLAGAMGDIGSHAENLLTTVTGLAVESICADLAGGVADAIDADYPRVEDGAGGVRFIEKLLESAHSAQKWTAMD